jgi:hypothetical protein
MDPYLEGSRWLPVHHELCSEFVRQISPKILPRYFARPTKRFVVVMPEGVAIEATSAYPDIAVLKGVEKKAPGSGTVVAPAPVRLATVVPESVPHATVEIRDAENRQLVTAIEVLSPYNKRREGREEYLEKRGKLLRSTAHLLEIDLLRSGERVPMRQKLPDAPYFVFLSRAFDRPFTEVWGVGLDQRLPEVPVPLLPGDMDVSLDLQQALTNIYDLSGYGIEIDYSRPPEVPLPAEWTAWATERIRAWRETARC